MPRLGVLGWPVAHSRSPAIHNAALAELGMGDWRYQRLPVPPALFTATVRALRNSGFVGANATIPHKQAALAVPMRRARRPPRSVPRTPSAYGRTARSRQRTPTLRG